MTIEDARAKLELSKSVKQYTPTLMAIIITYHQRFDGMDPSQVCNMLGVPSTYKHTVRALLQVPDIIDQLQNN